MKDVYEIKNKTVFSTHKRPHRSGNDNERSCCQEPTQDIMLSGATAMTSTKSRTRLFSQHASSHIKQQAQWYSKISLPKTNTGHNDNHIYEHNATPLHCNFNGVFDCLIDFRLEIVQLY